MTAPLVEITDPADPRLADFANLGDPDIRRLAENERWFVAEGPEVVRRLVDSGLPVRCVVVAPNRLSDLGPHLERCNGPVYVAERSVISAVAGFPLHRGVIASAQRPDSVSLASVLAAEPRAGSTHRLAVLENVNDHENIGAIARSARAFGLDALVLDPTCADPWYRRCVRVSMGEILMLPIVRATVDEVTREIAARGGETWALTPERTARTLGSIEAPDGPIALLLGAEGAGLSSDALASATRQVRIPIVADVDSLNVGHAAAVAFAAVSPPR